MPAAALIPAAIGAAGAIGSGIAGAAGVGKNSYRATTFDKTSAYDPNRFEYGGKPGGADEFANYYAQQATDAQNRQGPQANYGETNAYQAQGQQSRAGQANMVNLMAARAAGQTPSIAGMQAAQDMQRAQASQASMAASARGPAALALAQQQAANNVANTQGQISGQAQINAANERMQAEQSAMGAYNAMRGTDQASEQAAQQRAQYQAGLEAQQRALNDQYAMGMTQNSMAVRNAQLNAGMNQQQMMAQSLAQSQGINAGINQNNANTGMQFFQAGLGAAMGGAQGSMGMMGKG